MPNLGPGAAAAGFAEAFSNTIANHMMEAHALKRREEVQMQGYLVKAAMQGQIPIEDPTVKKAYKTVFGQHADAFMQIGSAIAQHKLGQKNEADETLLRHLNDNPDDPMEGFRGAVKELVQSGKEVPKEWTTQLAQSVVQPAISASRTAAEMGVKYGPQGTALRAGSEAAVTGARQEATLPYTLNREARGEARRIGAEGRAEARRQTVHAERLQDKLDQEARADEEDVRKRQRAYEDAMAKAGQKVFPQKFQDEHIVVDAQGNKLDIPGDQYTPDTLNAVRAQGGRVLSRGFMDKWFGPPGRPVNVAPRPRNPSATKGSMYDPQHLEGILRGGVQP